MKNVCLSIQSMAHCFNFQNIYWIQDQVQIFRLSWDFLAKKKKEEEDFLSQEYCVSYGEYMLGVFVVFS